MLDVLCSQTNQNEIPEGFIDYEANPREYLLTLISTIVKVDSRVSDIYSNPYEQIKEQLRLSI